MNLVIRADRWIFKAVRRRRTPMAAAVAKAVSGLAEPRVAHSAVAGATLYTALRHRRRADLLHGAAALLTVRTGMAFRHAACQRIGRERPPASAWLITPAGYSLPSRHTTLAALAAATCAQVIRTDEARRWAAPGIAAAGIGASRVVLGVHWPTDVLAGWLFAVAWLEVTLRLRARVACVLECGEVNRVTPGRAGSTWTFR